MQFDLGQALAVLERTPGTLSSLLSGLGDAWIAANEGPESWSPYDVVGHLIDAEETNWLPRARVALGSSQDRRFPPFDRFRHLAVKQTLAERLDRFAEVRSDSLGELRRLELGPVEFARTAIHPEFGEVRLDQLLATWVVHDLAHLGQIARVMAKQYAEAVGPWQAYLPILRR
ncbi:MAG: DinB family protein [Gemmatimonadales bacterium]